MAKSTNTAKRIVRTFERGDSGSLGFNGYIPFLFFIMLFAFTLALIGFWRVGTVAANERGAYMVSTSHDQGAAEASMADIFTGVTSSQAGSNPNADAGAQESRHVVTDSQADANAQMMFFGDLRRSIGAQSQKRFEQFYAGPAQCSGSSCEE